MYCFETAWLSLPLYVTQKKLFMQNINSRYRTSVQIFMIYLVVSQILEELTVFWKFLIDYDVQLKKLNLFLASKVWRICCVYPWYVVQHQKNVPNSRRMLHLLSFTNLFDLCMLVNKNSIHVPISILQSVASFFKLIKCHI